LIGPAQMLTRARNKELVFTIEDKDAEIDKLKQQNAQLMAGVVGPVANQPSKRQRTSQAQRKQAELEDQILSQAQEIAVLQEHLERLQLAQHLQQQLQLVTPAAIDDEAKANTADDDIKLNLDWVDQVIG
jgi:predicted RNase H-like nuclease (RuvC/YqgF family)